MTNAAIPPHGGYKNLKSFQSAVIVYDFTVEFCKRYVPQHKLRDQIEGAARSGCQNIAEGSQNSGTSKQTELRLMSVARGSLEELARDYQDFLRQRNLLVWDKSSPRTQEVRALAYRSNRSYSTYQSYIENPESAANVALCLIFQTTYLLDQQLRALEKALLEQGDIPERIKHARTEEKKKQLLNPGPDYDEFLNQFGLKRLENGQVVKKNPEK
jgi:restriction system protein